MAILWTKRIYTGSNYHGEWIKTWTRPYPVSCDVGLFDHHWFGSSLIRQSEPRNSLSFTFKEDEFTHRNGRTARMTTSGTAWMLCTWEREKKWSILIGMVTNFPTSIVLPKPPLISNDALVVVEKQTEQNWYCWFLFRKETRKRRLRLIEVKDFISRCCSEIQ
jgi:hypothetical protein